MALHFRLIFKNHEAFYWSIEHFMDKRGKKSTIFEQYQEKNGHCVESRERESGMS